MKLFQYGFQMEQPFFAPDEGAGSGGAPVMDNTQTQTDPTQQTTQETTPNVSAPTNEISIDGFGTVKIDEIKEWKNGYMRQSDYTKKTQEVARQRKETQEAIELYNYLKNNPQVAQALTNGDASALQNAPGINSLNPINSQLETLNMKIAGFELDSMINSLKSKYPDFNEVEVLTEADRLHVADLEFVYNALQGKKLPTLKEQLQKEIEKSITDKIRQNGLETQSIIAGNDSIPQANHGLSNEELVMAQKMGMTPEAYASGKKYMR